MSDPKDQGAPPGAIPGRERRLAADLYLHEDEMGTSTEPEVFLPNAREAVPPTVQVPARDPLSGLPFEEGAYGSRPSLPYINVSQRDPSSRASMSPPPLSRAEPKLPPAITGIPLATHTPEERERYEPPTQPIDLAGYQELPLPSMVTIPPRDPSITEPPLPLEATRGVAFTPPPPRPPAISPLPPMPPPSPRASQPAPPAMSPPPGSPRISQVGIPSPFASQPKPPPAAKPPTMPPVGSAPQPSARISQLGITPLPPAVKQVIATQPPRAQPIAPPAPKLTLPQPGSARREVGYVSDDRLFAPLESAGSAPLTPSSIATPQVVTAPVVEPPREAAPAPRIDLDLPASILIADDDTRAGSELAARLLELGYGCRVTKLANLDRALDEAQADAVILEVPREDALGDRGRARIAALARYDGPILVTSPSVLPLDVIRDRPNIAATLTKPYFVEVLVESIESARKNFVASPPARSEERAETRRAPSIPPASTTAPLAAKPRTQKNERRESQRVELGASVVRAVISGTAEGQSGRGRVRNISTGGGLMIETSAKIPLKTAVTAELTLYDGRMLLFNGRVTRAGSKQDLALKLDCDDTQAEFLELYIEDARAPDGRVLQPIRINVRGESAAAETLDDVALMKRWLEVSAVLEDDELQQRFIQECLKAGRMEFAVARYRELKAQNPDDERPTKYLHQCGTILSFYALSKKDAANEVGPKKMPVMAMVVLGMVVLAAIALFMIMKQFGPK